eukprot:GEMP01033831.1.p1 GENE.GEMP01033831.1~~GEMP01033831.1.p1  ORF type:complete len:561 (+),score=156.28 GEMP01033831.1:89-1771(+)
MASFGDILQDTPLWQNVGALLLEAESRNLALKCVSGWHRAVLLRRNGILKEECDAWQFAAQGCSEWRKKYSLLQKRLTHEENRAEFATKACNRAQGDIISLQEETLSWKSKADAYEQEVEVLRKRLATLELRSMSHEEVEPQWHQQQPAVRGGLGKLNLSLNEELAQRQRAAVPSGWSHPRAFITPPYSTTKRTPECVPELLPSKDNLVSAGGIRHVVPSQPTIHGGDNSDFVGTLDYFQKSSLAHPPLTPYQRPQPTPATAAPQLTPAGVTPLTLLQERDASSAPWPRSGPLGSSWNPLATHVRDHPPDPTALGPLANSQSALNETLRESLLRDYVAEKVNASVAACMPMPSPSRCPDELHGPIRETQHRNRACEGADSAPFNGASQPDGAPLRPRNALTIQVPSMQVSETAILPEGVPDMPSFGGALDGDGTPGSAFLQSLRFRAAHITKGAVTRSNQSAVESAGPTKGSLELLRGIRRMEQEVGVRGDARRWSEGGGWEDEEDGLREARTLAAHILRGRRVERASAGVEHVSAAEMVREDGDVEQRWCEKPDFSDII